MSKIHQALKKAEKETTRDNDVLLFSPAGKGRKGPQRVPDRSLFDERLVSLSDPQSMAAEQYKKLRTRILQFPDFAPRTILITSASPQEGKTLTAANLAVTIAQGLDEHVLLVDGDLRRPSLHNFFGLDPAGGLSDYIIGDIDLSELLLETGVPKLKLLPSGSTSDNPSELLASKKMKDLIQELKSRYEDRYIIIDSPPVTITNEPDILAKQVDGTVIVVRAGKTPREVLEKTLQSLNGRNILGIVFNDVDPALKRVNYEYYGYHRYGNRGD